MTWQHTIVITKFLGGGGAWCGGFDNADYYTKLRGHIESQRKSIDVHFSTKSARIDRQLTAVCRESQYWCDDDRLIVRLSGPGTFDPKCKFTFHEFLNNRQQEKKSKWVNFVTSVKKIGTCNKRKAQWGSKYWVLDQDAVLDETTHIGLK